MVSISYAICVKDEINEISDLLELLFRFKRPTDEIVVLYDKNGSEKVLKFLESQGDNISLHKDKFKNHFGEWKTKLNRLCTKDYIINIDADEMPDEVLLNNIHKIIEDNPQCEAYWIPRVNIVLNMDERIKQWGWDVNQDGWVNWPDPQLRIYKNTKKMHWRNKVHEQVSGYQSMAQFPYEKEYAFWHIKSMDRQVKQNELYNKIDG